MNKTNPSLQLRGALGGALLTTLSGIIVLSHLIGDAVAQLSYDLPFLWRGNQTVEGVKVIYMDEDSATALGQPWGGAAWDRGEHARLLNRLKECHAKAVVFDILFAEPHTNDALLENAMKSAQQAGTKVILGGEAKIRTLAGGFTLTNVVPPLPDFAKAAAWGLAEWHPLRRHFPGTDGIPSLAQRAAELTGPSVHAPWPVERWINFYSVPGLLPHCSYAQALDPRLTSPNAFSNQVCFVGAWPVTPFAGGSVDEWDTPYSRWGKGKAPGVEITATIFLNLIRGDWMTRLPAWDEWTIIITAGILLGLGLALTRPMLAILLGAGVALAIAAVASWLMWQHHVWFSWLIISSVQVPVALGWSALLYARNLEKQQSKPISQAVTTKPDLGAANTPVPVSGSLAHADAIPNIPEHTMLRSVARGAYGEIWLARNAIGTYHAVKVIRRDRFDSPDPFEREFRGLQRFMPISRSHPGLVQILQVGRRDDEGFIYYVMEAADDENTGVRIEPASYSPRILAKEIRKRRHLTANECLQLGLDLTAALQFLHQQQLIHRDIKPANIIFVNGAPKFADIGLVTDIPATGQAVTYLGTKGYIAPEGPGTPSADVYSLGKVLYEASMGLNCEMFPELPATLVERSDHSDLLRLNKILLKACRQDATQRYQTAAELLDELRQAKSQMAT